MDNWSYYFYINVLENGFMPEKQHRSDAGFDLKTPISFRLLPNESKLVDFNIIIQLNPGFMANIYPRSSLSVKKGCILTNSVGIIDADYRGNIKANIKNISNSITEFKRGDRIVQMVIQFIPDIILIQTDLIDKTNRGSGGFGSTGE